MLFNSIEFLVFYPIVFFLYWKFFAVKIRPRALFIIAASYIFYGWWDYRFLSLIIISTLIDYSIGTQLAKTENPRTRKSWLLLSLFSNLGILGFFKYYNFFVASWEELFSSFGISWDPLFLNVALPVGISFYTFQTLSYTIDVYRKKIPPCEDIFQFAAYVCFFPQLVAGPIERASHLLPQFALPARVKRWEIRIGLKQMLWGFFKKIVIADSCAPIVNQIFQSPDSYSSGMLIAGSILFAFQIYGDFSGYSDIAIGTSRLLGFKLMDNFNYPYFSRSIPEFWRRWHISLSTWFRDYLYIPLGGSRGTFVNRVRNVFIVFLVSGLWHGANWTFVFWGLIHALLFMPGLLLRVRMFKSSIFRAPTSEHWFLKTSSVIITFAIVCIAWIFFRASSISEAWTYLSNIPINWKTNSISGIPGYISGIIILFILTEFISRRQRYPVFYSMPNQWGRSLAYSVTVIFILVALYLNDEQTFIYFQF
ncbi:MBOAT family O-acyltransferase [Fulvivirga sedimenti]|uniref:MBOAT family protein n=1 Tax=Fulvivirga sedimenti TaxID=2879465 RepID=A0A9X1HLX8_9BACT|nr:MBOAT family O-acyltransferase [Fulvivirga sedimenti]MCA6073420.1 MBOAT family protein [Fulvivirga sedimenti]